MELPSESPTVNQEDSENLVTELDMVRRYEEEEAKMYAAEKWMQESSEHVKIFRDLLADHQDKVKQNIMEIMRLRLDAKSKAPYPMVEIRKELSRVTEEIIPFGKEAALKMLEGIIPQMKKSGPVSQNDKS